MKEISEKLKEKGYPVNGLGVSFPEKVIESELKAMKTILKLKKRLKKLQWIYLQSRNYDADTVKVNKYEEPNLTKKIRKR